MQKFSRPLQQKFAIIAALTWFTAVAFAQTDAERASQAGELKTIKNFRVLHLKGDNIHERGFAHGYLLAADIRDDLDAALNSLPNFGADSYESNLLPWSTNKFHWDADAKAELDGVWEGMRAKLGKDGLKSKTLNRELKREDLNAINALADYFGPACSGFVAWGSRTPNGEVIHGRTLDFPLGPKPVADQVVFAYESLPQRGKDKPARKAWVSIGWPGLIVQFTGMNSDGFSVCLHDAYNRKRGGHATGFVPRGMLLRRMLETIDPAAADPIAAAAAMAAKEPIACGNLFQISFPQSAAEKFSVQPGAVLEFDPHDLNVSVRKADEAGLLVLTNHFRVRSEPVECDRFKKMCDTATAFNNDSRKIGIVEARKMLMSAEQPVAAHSVYFFPDKLELSIALTRGNVMSPRVAPTAFKFKDLFE